LTLLLSSGTARAALRDLQAHGAAERLWLARVEPQPGTSPGEVTTLFVRVKGVATWQRLDPIGSRLLGLASRGSQLVMLLPNGDWLLMTDSGPTSGRPLPGKAHIIALGSDATTLWAVGLRPDTGTLQPTTVPTTAPDPAATDLESAATAPATAPTSRPKEEAAGGGGQLSLYLLGPLGWEERGPLPGEIPAVEGVSVSLAVVGGRPVLAYKAGDRVARVFRRGSDTAWESLGDVEMPADLQDFKVLEGTLGPILWLRGMSGPDRLWIWRGRDGGPPVFKELKPQGPGGPAEQTVTAANGALRLLWFADDLLFEQRLNPGTGEPDGPPQEIRLPAANVWPAVSQWAQLVVMGALIFAMAASMRRRREMQDVALDPSKLPLAPLSLRLLAAVIDLVPVVLVTWFVPVPHDQPPEIGYPIKVMAGFGVYLVITTMAELVAGRSLGKLATGLRVVGLDGKPATAGARLVRNVLRILDFVGLLLPLLLVVFSPLRQRAGDFAAGTLVVRDEAAAEDPEASNDEPAHNDESRTKKSE
jgi:uncharacterized RDD family membrane protein YckC